MTLDNWSLRLRTLHEKALEDYLRGKRGADQFFSAGETAFLESIGLRPIHVYDCVEDLSGSGEPEWETSLLMIAARRDFFLYEQHGEWSGAVVPENDLPLREDKLGGIAWLPRILAKARGYLRGELAPEIMYCCGGDRRFLKEYRLHPADFLRIVWSAGDDDAKVLASVKASREQAL